MWRFMVVTFFISTRCASGRCNYLKSDISFQLPNYEDMQSSGDRKEQEQKNQYISLPYDNYQYLQQLKYKETENKHLSYQQDFSNVGMISAKLNPTIIVPIQSSEEQTSLIGDLNFIKVYPGIPKENDLQLIGSVNKEVTPSVHLHNSITQARFLNRPKLFPPLPVPNSRAVLEGQNNESHLLSVLNLPTFVNLHKKQIFNTNLNNNPALSTQIKSIDSQISNRNSDKSPQHVNNVIKPVAAPLLKQHHYLSPGEKSQIPTKISFSPQSNKGEVLHEVKNELPIANSNELPLEKDNLSITNLGSATSNGLIKQNNQLIALKTQSIPPQPNNNLNVSPLITKSISFHVPPPDMEEKSVTPVVKPTPSPQKNYKIIFIKAPTQESRPNIQLGAGVNSSTPVEDKTLIYVLVEKPVEHPDPIILPQPTEPSDHEVLFVHYDGTPNINDQEIK